MKQFFQKLPIAESLAVCVLRHEFLKAWRTSVHEVPKQVFDLYPATLHSTRHPPGGKLFVAFLDWLETYLSTRMLSNCG